MLSNDIKEAIKISIYMVISMPKFNHIWTACNCQET